MGLLTYRVHQEASDWLWEVLAREGGTLASGSRKTDAEASAEAIRAALRLTSQSDAARKN
jgi:hypothetical protein